MTKMNQGQPLSHAFLVHEITFFASNEWNAASLFMSKLVGLKRSQVLSTGGQSCQYNLTYTSRSAKQINFHNVFKKALINQGHFVGKDYLLCAILC